MPDRQLQSMHVARVTLVGGGFCWRFLFKLEEEDLLRKIVELADLLERCQFRDFWVSCDRLELDWKAEVLFFFWNFRSFWGTTRPTMMPLCRTSPASKRESSSVIDRFGLFLNLVRHWLHFCEIQVILHIVSKTYQTIDYNEIREMLGDLSGKSVSSRWFYKWASSVNPRHALIQDDEMKKLLSVRNWRKVDGQYIFVANHDESIKTKNIVEKISFSGNFDRLSKPLPNVQLAFLSVWSFFKTCRQSCSPQSNHEHRTNPASAYWTSDLKLNKVLFWKSPQFPNSAPGYLFFE